MNKEKLTLGIETSCDETGAAVYSSTRGLLSNALYSQIALHRKTGGVLPEVASRSQLEKINPIVEAALEQANVALDDIDTIAVTNKPGLPGSLLVGVCFAKALAWASGKKLIGVNHLEGHAFSPFLQFDVPFPHLCITASGGHTSLYLVKGFGDYEVLGQTVDDAAGEAFDKVAKLIQLPYPGGPEIEKAAQQAGFKDYFTYPRSKSGNLDFSFSGLKTAVLYDLIDKKAYDLKTKTFNIPERYPKLVEQVASSLLVCVADIFKQKIKKAIETHPDVKAITFVGGVACNKYIRGQLQDLCKKYNLPLYIPNPQFCTDNGAMIAFVGNYKAQQNIVSNWNLDILR